MDSGDLDRAVTAPAALELVGMTKRYRNGVTIGPLSFAVQMGEFVSVLGPSGCGKTTMLRAITGFETVDAGEIRLCGVDIRALPPHQRKIGLVFQNYALFPHLTALQNVLFGLRFARMSAQERRARARAVLSMVGLSAVEDRRPAQLSGGQQQRVAIARVVVLEPNVMLLDEPLSNLDLKLRIQMRHELRSIQRQLGVTFIYVTHDQSEAMALSDRVIVLSQGQIAQIGTPEEIYLHPRTRFVADFVGISNFLNGEIAHVSADSMSVALPNGALLRTRGCDWARPGTAVTLCIRPEALQTCEPHAANGLVGRVIETVFSGDRVEAMLELAEHNTVFTCHTRGRPHPNAAMWVRADPGDIAVLPRA